MLLFTTSVTGNRAPNEVYGKIEKLHPEIYENSMDLSGKTAIFKDYYEVYKKIDKLHPEIFKKTGCKRSKKIYTS